MSVFVGVLGGLGLFLYGMRMMGAGLQKAAGKKLERIIEVLTTNRFMGVIVGMLVTGVIQSSSATTVMVVGFVNAGLMKLTQAVGVIMGANIGTTITGQIVSLSVDQIAPIAIGIGMILLMFGKKGGQRNLAEILIGLGILFFGMEFLKDSLKPLRELEAFQHLMLTLSHNPLLGVVVGFCLTFIVQSSSASITMLIALASQGLLPLEAALPILYGDNIGTCTTALLSSIGASRNAKRAAIIHLIFNTVGTILFVLVLSHPISFIVKWLDPTDVPRQIANAHTLFNFANVIIQFPFALLLVKAAMWLVPDKPELEKNSVTQYIDKRILETPTIALQSTIKETIYMGEKSLESLTNTMSSFFDRKTEQLSKTFEIEKTINQLENEITDYLVELSNCEIMDSDRRYIDGLFNNINDIERIGDHSENIAEIFVAVADQKIQFSKPSIEMLEVIHAKTKESLELAIESIRSPKEETIDRVNALEEEIDVLERAARKDHFERLNASICDVESGVYYLEVINNLERISDLASNLAKVVRDTVKVVPIKAEA